MTLSTIDGRLLYIPLRILKPGNLQRTRETLALQELTASVAEMGILQPLTVKKQGEGFQVVSGNRRLMAARQVGLGEVPCILLQVEESETELMGLLELLQREDLHYLEEAEYLKEFLRRSGLTQAKAAKKLGRSQSAVANKVRLLSHPAPIRQLLREKGLHERHARELLRVPEGARQEVLLEIARRNYSIAQTEQFIDRFLSGVPSPQDGLSLRRDMRMFLQRIARETELLSALPSEEKQGNIFVQSS